MADVKISALPTNTAVTDDDYVAFVNDPLGTPVTQKITVSDLKSSLVESIYTSDGTVLTGRVVGLTDTLTFGTELLRLDETNSRVVIGYPTAEAPALNHRVEIFGGNSADNFVSLQADQSFKAGIIMTEGNSGTIDDDFGVRLYYDGATNLLTLEEVAGGAGTGAGSGDIHMVMTRDDGKFGFSTASPTARLHSVVNDAENFPGMRIDQNDSTNIVNALAITSSSTGNAVSITQTTATPFVITTGTGSGIFITRTAAGTFFQTNDGTDTVSLVQSQGNPEGVHSANIGSFALDSSLGKAYVKTSDSLNTGWVELASAKTDVLSEISFWTQLNSEVPVGGSTINVPSAVLEDADIVNTGSYTSTENIPTTTPQRINLKIVKDTTKLNSMAFQVSGGGDASILYVNTATGAVSTGSTGTPAAPAVISTVYDKTISIQATFPAGATFTTWTLSPAWGANTAPETAVVSQTGSVELLAMDMNSSSAVGGGDTNREVLIFSEDNATAAGGKAISINWDQLTLSYKYVRFVVEPSTTGGTADSKVVSTDNWQSSTVVTMSDGTDSATFSAMSPGSNTFTYAETGTAYQTPNIRIYGVPNLVDSTILAVEDMRVVEYAKTTSLGFGPTYSLDNSRTWQNLKDDYEYLEFNYEVDITGVTDDVLRTITIKTADIRDDTRWRLEYGVGAVDLQPAALTGGDWTFAGATTDEIALEIVGVKAQKTVINTNDAVVNDQTASGYIEIGTRLEQEGTGTVGTPVVFPTAFKTATTPIVMVSNALGSSDRLITHGNVTTTGFDGFSWNIGANTASTGETFTWTAVGQKA